MRATQLQSAPLVKDIAEYNFAKTSGVIWVARICGP
jgi:hypothetical protein